MLKSRAYSLFLKYIFNIMLQDEFKNKHVVFRDCWLSFTEGCSVFTEGWSLFAAGGAVFYVLFCVSVELAVQR